VTKQLVIECALIGIAVCILRDLCGLPWWVAYLVNPLCCAVHGYARAMEHDAA
jgi:hypothetical protein